MCVDTTLLIFTQQTEPPDGQQEVWEAAQAYEKWIRESAFGVLVPTPVVSEFLTGDVGEANSVMTTLREFADITPFDLRAAELAGELRRSYWQRIGLPGGREGQQLTVDMMIAATAIVNGSKYIVTHDTSDFDKITADFDVEVRGIEPGPPGQQKLDIPE
ncbi:MAG: type II toxin-antitoxin system VapC family toxin [Bradymonadaceae bacterium]